MLSIPMMSGEGARQGRGQDRGGQSRGQEMGGAGWDKSGQNRTWEGQVGTEQDRAGLYLNRWLGSSPIP